MGKAKAAVHAAHDEYVKAVGNHDAAAVAALYAKDARLMPPGEPMVTGRSNIEAWGKGMFDMGVRSLEMEELDLIEHVVQAPVVPLEEHRDGRVTGRFQVHQSLLQAVIEKRAGAFPGARR